MSRNSVPSERTGTLFAALLVLFLAVASGRLLSVDEASPANLALAVAGFQWDDIPFTKYAIGQTLLEIPFAALGLLLAKLAPAHNGAMLMGTLSLLPALLGAGIGVWSWHLSRAAGHSLRAAGLVAIAATLGSPVFVYGTRFFSELPQALALTAAVVLALRGAAPWATGLALGALILLKPASGALAVPFVAIYIALDPRLRANRPRAALQFSVPLVLAVAMVLRYNWARYGSAFEFGYSEDRDQEYGFHTSLWTGLYGLTFSSGASLLVFMPVCVPAWVGLVRLVRRVTRSGVMLIGIPVAFLLFHAKWWSWHGGWCWGPRFLVPVIPLVALGLGELDRSRWTHPRKAAFALLLVVSVAVQVPGLMVSANDYNNAVFNACQGKFPVWSPATSDRPSGPVDDQANTHFIPSFSPPLGHSWIAVNRLFGPVLAAPWVSGRFCASIELGPAPLEFWWSREISGGWMIAGLMAFASAMLFRRWWRTNWASI